MWKYDVVKQFQFVQKDKGVYELILNVDRNLIEEEEIINNYKQIMGNESIITIKYCNDIPVLASGKRRYIVNEMKITN